VAFLSRGAGRREVGKKLLEMFLKKIYIGCFWRGAVPVEGDEADGLLFYPSTREIITQQYPDNKEEMKLPERFRGGGW